MTISATGPPLDVWRPPSFTAAVATPTTVHDVSWSDENNAAGVGQFSIVMADDPAYGDIEINDIFAIRLPWTGADGSRALAASFIVEQIHEHTMDVGGQAKEVATYSGRSVDALLEWAIIEPALGDQHKPIEEDAVFDWRSPRYDPGLDSWAAATEIDLVDDAADPGGSWPTQPMADRFDRTVGAYMIDKSGTTTSAGDRFWRLFYRDITITVPGRYGIEMLMDNLGFFWVDGIQHYEVMAEDGFKTASFKRLELSAATHRFCWAVYNFEDEVSPPAGQGPAALAYNLFKADLQDLPLDGGDRWVSDSDTNVLYTDDDPWPGMTVGDTLTQLLAEADTRGRVTWITPDFDADDDTDAAAWDRIPGVTTKTGTTTVLQFMEELTAAGRIGHWRLLPDAVTLHVHKPGYVSDPGVDLDPAPSSDPNTGQLLLLDRKVT